MRILNGIESLGRTVNSILEKICLIMLVGMTCIIWLQVFYRYFLRVGLPWAEEVSKYLMVWMALLGAAIVLYEQSHVSIDFFIEKLGIIRPLKILHLLLGIAFFVLMIIYGFDYAFFGMRLISPATGIRRFWPYLAIPVGGIFLFLQSIILLIRLVTGQLEIKRSLRSEISFEEGDEG